ncbi:MAG TPA: InlB B-repeat-containing protein [Bacilli bacterium]|nr:InlB B-repeat-containing protein [Bacilli bacterium]
MLKKIGIFAILIAFISFAGFSVVKGLPGEPINMVPGASIRTAGNQGLKFSATFDNSVLTALGPDDDRGFFVMYGEASIGDLQLAAISPSPETYLVNGKTIIRRTEFDKTSNEISIVLTGIPAVGYNQDITVAAFTLIDGVYALSPTVVTRSVSEVALKAANAGAEASVAAVTTELGNNYFKAGFDEFGKYVISSSLYEYDRVLLRDQFIADWNAFTGTTFTALVGTTFFASAKVGLSDAIGSNKNLSNGNLYKFFNDTAMKAKWGWFLDFITNNDGTTHPSRQIVAIKGNGTNGDLVLYHGDQLSYSIVNFFNKSYVIGGYSAINFTTPLGLAKYNNIPAYNNKVYADYASYTYVKKGASFTLPAADVIEGYTITGFNDGSTTHNPGATYVASSTTEFTVEKIGIPYDIVFMDGVNVIASLATTYTVANEKTLPTYVKAEHVFNGWYDNPELSGTVITSIPAGNAGNKIYYAKTTASANVPVEVTFNLNGGYLNYNSKDEMLIDLLTDLYAYVGATESLSDFMHGTGKTSGYAGTWFSNAVYKGKIYKIGRPSAPVSPSTVFIEDSLYYDKWLSFFDLIETLTVEVNATQHFWTSTYTGFMRLEAYVKGAATPFSPSQLARLSENTTNTGNLVITMLESEVLTLLPCKVGYSFAGWYDGIGGTGNLITTYPGYKVATPITYYAKWTVSP